MLLSSPVPLSVTSKAGPDGGVMVNTALSVLSAGVGSVTSGFPLLVLSLRISMAAHVTLTSPWSELFVSVVLASLVADALAVFSMSPVEPFRKQSAALVVALTMTVLEA